jgi:hypothetical protein
MVILAWRVLSIPSPFPPSILPSPALPLPGSRNYPLRSPGSVRSSPVFYGPVQPSACHRASSALRRTNELSWAFRTPPHKVGMLGKPYLPRLPCHGVCHCTPIVTPPRPLSVQNCKLCSTPSFQHSGAHAPPTSAVQFPPSVLPPSRSTKATIQNCKLCSTLRPGMPPRHHSQLGAHPHTCCPLPAAPRPSSPLGFTIPKFHHPRRCTIFRASRLPLSSRFTTPNFTIGTHTGHTFPLPWQPHTPLQAPLQPHPSYPVSHLAFGTSLTPTPASSSPTAPVSARL